jgi:DNA invertase Pin-like site-specific DNA recombinase
MRVGPERWLVAARLSRVSKKDRERGDEAINGIQTQDRQTAQWAASHGHVIVDVTKDRNISGAVSPWDRPELGPWLTDPAKIIQYDGIVAYDVSRLSRDYADLADLRKWAEAHGKMLYVIKDRLRWPDNRDGMLWGVSAERAYQERQDTIERVGRELDALRTAGKLVGRPPFGYTTEGPKYDRRLVPTEDGRKYIPEIYRRCIAGDSMITIAGWLRSEGVRPISGVWYPRTVASLIRNPVYIGQRSDREPIPPDETETAEDGRPIRYRYGNRWVENPRYVYGKPVHLCEPLLVTEDAQADTAAWDAAQEAMRSRPKRGHVDEANRAMLSGVLYCPHCDDSPMYRHKAGSIPRQRGNFYYRCTGRGSQRTSCGNSVSLEKADAAVDRILAESFNKPIYEVRVKRGKTWDAELRAVNFKLKQLSSLGLGDEEEDRRRRDLRAERDDYATRPDIPDTTERVSTGRTYLEEWNALSAAQRGPWLARHGFTVTAAKAGVTVRLGTEAHARRLVKAG